MSNVCCVLRPARQSDNFLKAGYELSAPYCPTHVTTAPAPGRNELTETERGTETGRQGRCLSTVS